MHLRLYFGKALIRGGRLIEMLAPGIMRPQDLLEFNRAHSSSSRTLSRYNASQWIRSGLRPEEQNLLDKITFSGGNALLIGIEGGRIIAALQQKGFQITAADMAQSSIDLAEKNCADSGIRFTAIKLNPRLFDLPVSSFNFIWLSDIFYSTVPTRSLRISFLKNIHSALKPAGQMICQYLMEPAKSLFVSHMKLKKIIARLTLGNRDLQPGDGIQEQSRFVHCFTGSREITEEFNAAGMKILYMQNPPQTALGGLLAKKDRSF